MGLNNKLKPLNIEFEVKRIPTTSRVVLYDFVFTATKKNAIKYGLNNSDFIPSLTRKKDVVVGHIVCGVIYPQGVGYLQLSEDIGRRFVGADKFIRNTQVLPPSVFISGEKHESVYLFIDEFFVDGPFCNKEICEYLFNHAVRYIKQKEKCYIAAIGVYETHNMGLELRRMIHMDFPDVIMPSETEPAETRYPLYIQSRLFGC